jgi:hypothetical protein
VDALRPFVVGGSGERAGDVAVKVGSIVPSNTLTKAALAKLRVSRKRAPSDIRAIGFSRIEFSSREGLTLVALHKGQAGASSANFNPHSSNIGAVQVLGEPELAVFDVGRERIGATRIVSTQSLDDQDSAASIALELAIPAIHLAALAAGDPGIGRKLISAIPEAVYQGRLLHGTLADEQVRIAQMQRALAPGTTLFIRIGRTDRGLDPPDWMDGATHSSRWTYVLQMLDTLTTDVMDALTAFRASPAFRRLNRGGQFITDRLVARQWLTLCDRSRQAFNDDLMWPLSLRLVCLDDGPTQFVRRVAYGELP